MDLIDEIIQNAQKSGEFSNLPGQGKPLNLDDDPHTPPHLRMAHKLLKDNDYTPEWIAQGQDLDRSRAALVEDLRRAARAYRGALNDADRSSEPVQNRQRAEQTWKQAQAALQDRATQYNRGVLSYNLKVPRGVTHKLTFDVAREMDRLWLGG